MSKFTSPPIVLELKSPHNPIKNQKGKIWITFNSDKYPIGREFTKQIDGKKYKFKVTDHRYIGTQIVAVILDNND